MIAVPPYFERDQDVGGDFRSSVIAGCGRLGAGLAAALESEGIHSAWYDHAAEALRDVQRAPPDLLLVGPRLEDREPLRFLEDVSRYRNGGAVLFLADRPDRRDASRVLEHGADDVVTPPHSAAVVLLRAHVVARRRAEAPARPLGRRLTLGRLRIDLDSRRVIDGGRPVNLTGREFELLLRLVEARGDVVSRDALLEDIWGEDQDSHAVLDATVHRLRRKLEPDLSEPKLVTTVRGVGYRLEADAGWDERS